VKTYFITLLIFLGIDAVWLLFLAKDFYEKELSAFSRHLNLPAAILTYLLLVLGLVFFVFPLVQEKSNLEKFLIGALFGIICYSVYDLTNLATLSQWSLKMALVDMIWGGIICGTTTLIASLILK
jgi:uncharacterized membrane protein